MHTMISPVVNTCQPLIHIMVNSQLNVLLHEHKTELFVWQKGQNGDKMVIYEEHKSGLSAYYVKNGESGRRVVLCVEKKSGAESREEKRCRASGRSLVGRVEKKIGAESREE